MTGLCTVRKPRISSNGARLFALLELDWRQCPQPTVAAGCTRIAYQTWSSCGRSYAGRNAWLGETPFAARSQQFSGRFPFAVAPASFGESLCSRNFSVSFCMSVIAF
jgi:hypothetical protein